MKVYAGNWLIPYPMAMIKSRLLLSGVHLRRAEGIVEEIAESHKATQDWPTEKDIIHEVDQILSSYDKDYGKNLETVNKYYQLRREGDEIPPIVLILEGASATGKSMLLLSTILALGATRFVSTDSIRQVLRTQISKEDYPELFCHTYQAHEFNQVGPESLGAVVRGFLAQEQIIKPVVTQSVVRVIAEGTEAIIEGVHVIPGELSSIAKSVLEVIIEPGKEMHRAMFMSKKSLAGLKTVGGATNQRELEFKSTREIQDYILDKAADSNIRVIHLEDYQVAFQEISMLIRKRMEALIT